MDKSYSATDLPPSPGHARNVRMRNYLIAMGVRVACLIALLFVRDWWMLVFAAGAIFLPYVAVVLANVGSPGETGEMERPAPPALPAAARLLEPTEPSEPSEPSGVHERSAQPDRPAQAHPEQRP